jgi:hypothetical protein
MPIHAIAYLLSGICGNGTIRHHARERVKEAFDGTSINLRVIEKRMILIRK